MMGSQFLLPPFPDTQTFLSELSHPPSQQRERQIQLPFVQSSAERAATYRIQAQERIEEEFLNMVRQVVAGEKPYLIQTKVFNGNTPPPKRVSKCAKDECADCGSTRRKTRNMQALLPTLPGNLMYVKFGVKMSQRKYTLLFILMAKIYEMAINNQCCTIRDLYYENVDLYGTQERLEVGLYDLCHVLKVPRDALRVEATSKGVMAGDLRYRTGYGPHAHTINLSQFKSGMLIPGMSSLDDMCDIESDAQQIIVVEKDAIFQRLIGERIFDEIGPTILITGKGYPDLVTLKMIRKLRDSLNLKVFAFVDCDPYGIEIASVIRWGSYKQASIAKCTNDPSISEELTVPDLIWLGLLPSEIGDLCLGERASSVMSVRDKRKLTFVNQRISTKGDTVWLHEVEVLGESGIKAELEALFFHTRFASFYIKQKLNAYFQISRRSEAGPLVLTSK